MIVFLRNKKTGVPRQRKSWSREESQQQTQPVNAGNRLQATLVVGECFRYLS